MAKNKNLDVICIIRCIFICISFCSCNYVKAQHMVARPIPFFYQLYSNEVFDIYQDRTGYLWFGMTSGLARYDGYRLHTFRSNYKHSDLLSDNRVVYITDNDRYVWIATGVGITLYDKQTWKTTKILDKRIKDLAITDIVTNPSTEEVWVAAGNHVFRCSPDGKQVVAYGLQKDSQDIGFRQLYVDRDNRLWAMTYCGLFAYDKIRNSFIKYPPMPQGATPYTMLQDKQGHYWIGTWGDGLWLFNPKASDSTCYQRQIVKISGTNAEDKIFFSMAQDDQLGYLWMLSYDELHAMKYQKGKLEPVDISGIIDPHKMFTMILKDREGNLWLGSYDMGYTIYFDHSGAVSYTLPNLKETLHHDANIVNLGYDGADMLWMGQDRYGVLLYDLKNGTMTSGSTLGLGEVSLMKRSHTGGMWLKLRNQNRIVKAVRKSHAIQLGEDVQMNAVLANPGEIVDMNEDKDGNLWILTSTNLYVHKPHAAAVYTSGKEILRPDAFTVDNKGSAWGVKGNNIYRYSFDGHSIVSRTVGNMNVLSVGELPEHLCVDKLGALWVTTSLSRLVKSDVSKTKFHSQNYSHLSDGALLSIQSSGNKIWILTNKKLLSIDIHTLRETSYEANSENIAVKAFRGSALCPDLNGGVFAGGHNGFVHIKHDPDKQELPHNFGFRVSDILLNDMSMMFDNPDEDSHEGIVYLPADSRNIKICVASLLYAPGRIENVQYKLEGVDPDWMNLDMKNSFVFYSSLPSGKHRFMLRWQKADGSWTDAREIMLLVRRPAFYETTTAFVIYILLVLVGIYFIVYFVRRRASLSALRHYHNQVRVERLIDESHLKQQMPEMSEADKAFVKNVMNLIEEHIDDSEYGQEQLAHDLLLSRSTLYRKIKAVSGMSPLDFIRNVKMKKACTMLGQHKLSISEIAYSLGFANPKYFTKCFKDEMGQTPSEYQKQS